MTAEDLGLRARVERLERFALWVLVLVATVPMVIGGFLPWYTDLHGKDRTYRLFTQGPLIFGASAEDLAESDSSDIAFGVVFVACFLFLDVVTVVAGAVLVLMAAHAWRRVRANQVIAVLLVLCLVGAALTTALAAGGEATEVHPASLVLYGAGVLVTTGLLISSWLREWWLPDS